MCPISISRHCIVTDPSKILNLRDWPTTTTVDHLHCFLGLAMYYQRFIRGFAEISTSLRRLTENNVILV